MILVDPSVRLMVQEDIYDHIANCAKICYATTNTKVSSKNFVENILIKNKHLSMLRHATIYLVYKIDENIQDITYKFEYNKYIERIVYANYMYFIANGQSIYELLRDNIITIDFIKNHIITDLPEPLKEYKRFTFVCLTQISTSREFNRVSPNNIAERSTRYCNYSKDKFGNQITICKPHFYNNLSHDERKAFDNRLEEDEYAYIKRIQKGWKPEDARELLPLCTATEVAYTYSVKEWRQILNLRYYGTTGKPHPNAKIIATYIKDILFSLGYDCANSPFAKVDFN